MYTLFVYGTTPKRFLTKKAAEAARFHVLYLSLFIGCAGRFAAHELGLHFLEFLPEFI